jgi:hypothetical protein
MTAPVESADPTRLFARAMGPFLLVLGAALLAHARAIGPVIDGLAGAPALLFVVGLFTSAAGWALIVVHFRWRSVAQAVLSLLAFSLAVRGALLLFAPDLILRLAHAAPPALILASGGITLLLGCYLAFAGWRKPLTVPL